MHSLTPVIDKLSGRACTPPDPWDVPVEVASWWSERTSAPPPPVLAWIEAQARDPDLQVPAAEAMWLAARRGMDVTAAIPSLERWASGTVHDAACYAVLAMSCGSEGADRTAHLARLQALFRHGHPPLGRVWYHHVYRTWVRPEGHDGELVQDRPCRCAACRSTRTALVWSDLYGDNSGRQERREYRCADCGLFTVEHLDD